MAEVGEPQITPETPGRPAILNPFESPNDYHRLHEPFVPSPSIFRSSCASSATPAKFKWSIDEMSNLLPVDINPEDINRQSFYLSQTRIDFDIEQKRQNAIEQFFTKGAIVPSPWAGLVSTQKHRGKSSSSPLITEEPQSTRKTNATCQTTLSLPVDFDLEKVLGEHYKVEEVSEQVQETLSSSSLRRKLFLDGHGSGSESSNPPSPERPPHMESPSGKETKSSSFMSPLQCDVPILTPSSGQFSSSPIQGRFRNYSLGSVTSPMFPDRSSPTFKSPTLSPIGPQKAETPMSGERKHLTFLTPEGIPLSSSDMEVRCRGDSPYVEGCSPIRSCSPLRPLRHRAGMWGSPLHLTPISPILSSARQSVEPPHYAMELDCSSPRTEAALPGHTPSTQTASELMEQGDDSRGSSGQADPPDTTDRCGKEQLDCSWTKEIQEEEEEEDDDEEEEEEEEDDDEEIDGQGGNGLFLPKHLTSSRTGSLSNVESLHMFTSLLAEGSLIPTDGSMQVDSGYNTTSAGTTSLMEGISCDGQSKETLDTHIPEEGPQLYTKLLKSKIVLPHH